jgi:thiosulfate dehydrogenase
MAHWAGAALALLLVACGSAPPPVPPPPPPPVQVARAKFRVPADSEIPRDQVGISIRRGRAILAATRESLPDKVGNDLRCVSCHLDGGTRPDASPWIGVYSRFPQYRSRNGRVNVIEDRINDCFERSMNGKAIAVGSAEMNDLVAYFAFLSRGVAPPGDVPGQGFKKLDPLVPDTANGRAVFVAQCVRCHGADGKGVANPDSTALPRRYPPVWGPRSFNIGAGMARLNTAAAFIHVAMPFDRPGTLSVRDAFDVAGYVIGQPRPDFRGKENDWPHGDPPSDVAYRTRAKK